MSLNIMSYDTCVPENVREAFNVFQARVDDLRNSGFVCKTKNIKIDLFPQTAEPPIEGFDEDYLRSFLVTLRQFTLNKDPTYILWTHNNFQKHCPDENLKRWVAYARGLWVDAMKSRPVVFKSAENDYDVEKTLELFLYGGLVHSDLEKFNELENLPIGFSEFMTFSMITAFGRLLHALNTISQCIEQFKNGKESDAPMFGETESDSKNSEHDGT